MLYRTKTHSWISLIHVYQLLLGKIPKYLLIIQAVELSAKATVMQQFLTICIIMQKRFIVVLNSRFVEVTHCQKLGTRWRLRVRTKATMASKSYKKIYGDKETFSNISIMSSRVFGARLETC